MAIFKSFPDATSAVELVELAFRRAAKEGQLALARGGAKHTRARRSERARIKTASRLVQAKLGGFIDISLEGFSPFYLELTDALVGLEKLKNSRESIRQAVGRIKKLEKAYLDKVAKFENVEGVYKAKSEFYGRLASEVKKIDRDLEFFAKARETFRGFPSVEDVFTIVIAGAPNVGKSTLLRAMTPAEPRVESYPFTTKRILFGYFQSKYQRYQVVDTPGLLDRSIEERNPIEKQAILALKHLANAVIFLFDPSESCGFGNESQINIYREIKRQFPEVLPVINKADMLPESDIREFQKTLGDECIVCSAREKKGVEEIIERILRKTRS